MSPQKTRPDDSFLNFPVNTSMSPKHGDVLTYSTGTTQWTNGSGTSGLLDDRYLRLDTSNDPLTGLLTIIPSTNNTSGLSIQTMGDATGFSVTQQGTGTGGIVSPTFHLSREVLGNSSAAFSDPIMNLSQSRGNSGTMSGDMLRYDSDGNTRVQISPNIQGTGTLVSFDGDFTLSPGGMLLLLKNHATPRFYVNASGTAYSNDVPLIKEAPLNSGTYSRKNAGWTSEMGGRMFLPFGVYTNIQPVTANGSTPYSSTIDRTMTPIKWSQTVYIDGTSNGTNFWTIEIRRISDVVTLNTISTSGTVVGSTATLLTDTSWNIAPWNSSFIGVYLYVTKTGAPGDLYMFGPLVEVEV